MPEEHRYLLLKQGCLLREINPVIPPVGNEESPFSRAYFVINYCKLRLWKFVECEKMIYMDGDIQVLGFIDNLFDMPCGYFYAVMDCSCQMDGQCCAEALKWPKVVGEEPKYYFNGGIFFWRLASTHTHPPLEHPCCQTSNYICRAGFPQLFLQGYVKANPS